MSKQRVKKQGFMVTVPPKGAASCIETHHCYRDIYVMAFGVESPTTMRFLLNAVDEKEAKSEAKKMAKDIYTRREKDFPYLGKSYRSLDDFKNTPIQICSEFFKAVYYYEGGMIHPKETDKLPDGYARSDKDIFDKNTSEQNSQKLKRLSRSAIYRIINSRKFVESEYNYVSSLPASRKKYVWIIKNMCDLQDKHTKAEGAVFGALHGLKIGFIFQAPFIFDDKIYFADFYLQEKNLIIEVDGAYHEKQEQMANDRKRDNDFKKHGIKTLRIQNDVALDQKLLRGVLQAENII